MQTPPVAPDESERLKSLLSYEILDSASEQAYDDIVALASQICQVPTAIISLVDRDRQWFKAKLGLEATETPRNVSFCGHAIHESEILIVEDTQADLRFVDNPLVIGDPHIRFYCGAPLRTSDQFALGTLCVIDHSPRTLSEEQQEALKLLARQVVHLLELRQANLALRASHAELLAHTELIAKQQAQLVATAELAALGRMAGGIAHEINNPLAVIQGRSYQMRKAIEGGTIEAEKIVKSFEYIENLCLRISRIIRGLRTFARESPNDPFNDESLQRILDETLELCSERFRHHGVTINLKCDLQRKIRCRHTQMSQVFLNLLSNAFDAIEFLDERWIELTSELREDSFRIRVADSGAGIPDEVVAKIMQPFFTTKEVGKGTGLGLSIAKGIVESHGGTLFYDNIAGHTSFVIDLPIYASSDP